jgi:hypothetical protein
MPMFRAGLAVAALLIGGMAALLGIVVFWSVLQTGSVSLSYGTGGAPVSETVTQAADASRYWMLVVALGIAPAVLGTVAVLWGWRTLNQ